MTTTHHPSSSRRAAAAATVPPALGLDTDAADISSHPFSFRFPWEGMSNADGDGHHDDSHSHRQKRQWQRRGESNASASVTYNNEHTETSTSRRPRRHQQPRQQEGRSLSRASRSSHVVHSLEAAQRELLDAMDHSFDKRSDRGSVAAATDVGFGGGARRQRGQRYSAGAFAPPPRPAHDDDVYSYTSVGPAGRYTRQKAASHFGGPAMSHSQSLSSLRLHSQQRLDPRYSYASNTTASLLPPSLQRSSSNLHKYTAQSYVGDDRKLLPSERSRAREATQRTLQLPPSEPRTARDMVHGWLFGRSSGKSESRQASASTRQKSKTEYYGYLDDTPQNYKPARQPTRAQNHQHHQQQHVARDYAQSETNSVGHRHQSRRAHGHTAAPTIQEEPDDGLNEWGLPKLLVATKYDEEDEEEDDDDEADLLELDQPLARQEQERAGDRKGKHVAHAPTATEHDKHAPAPPKKRGTKNGDKVRYSSSSTTAVSTSPVDTTSAHRHPRRAKNSARPVTLRTLQKFLAMAYTLTLVCRTTFRFEWEYNGSASGSASGSKGKGKLSVRLVGVVFWACWQVKRNGVVRHASKQASSSPVQSEEQHEYLQEQEQSKGVIGQGEQTVWDEPAVTELAPALPATPKVQSSSEPETSTSSSPARPEPATTKLGSPIVLANPAPKPTLSPSSNQPEVSTKTKPTLASPSPQHGLKDQDKGRLTRPPRPKIRSSGPPATATVTTATAPKTPPTVHPTKPAPKPSPASSTPPVTTATTSSRTPRSAATPSSTPTPSPPAFTTALPAAPTTATTTPARHHHHAHSFARAAATTASSALSKLKRGSAGKNGVNNVNGRLSALPMPKPVSMAQGQGQVQGQAPVKKSPTTGIQTQAAQGSQTGTGMGTGKRSVSRKQSGGNSVGKQVQQ